MQKKGIRLSELKKVNLSLMDDVQKEYDQVVNQLWSIMGNINEFCQKNEAEFFKLKNLDVKTLLGKISDIETASKQLGVDLTPEMLSIKNAANVISGNAEKVFSKMISNNDTIQSSIGSFADQWGKY